MNTQYIVDQLTKLGVRDAEQVIEGMAAFDYVALVNALKQSNIAARNRALSTVLEPYGVELMANESDYLNTLFNKIREGKTEINQELLGEWLKPISDSILPDSKLLAMEGFNYYLQLEDDQQGDGLMDWLDENKVEYITDGKGQFHIKCNDRESAYRVGKAANGLISKKKVVRDNVEVMEARYTIYGRDEEGVPSPRDPTILHHETVLLSIDARSEEEARAKALKICGIRDEDITKITVRESKKANKREADAKAKMANIKTRNPDLLALSQRGGKGAHNESPRKNDPMDRKAKHKKSALDEAELSNDNTSADESRLEEGILGMKPLNPITRLRELAGMVPAKAVSPEADDLNDIEVDHDTSGFATPLAAGPVDVEDPFLAGTGADIEAAPDSIVDPMADLETMPVDAPADTPLDPMAMDNMGGVPGDLPPMAGEAPMMDVPTQSDAMSHIEDCLNDIQNKLSDIRLAEYKSLVQKLTSLTQQVQTMGRDYLGERRKK